MSATAFQTYTGQVFDALAPTPEAVDIRDIAHALSLQPRFTGHTRKLYSVAQHSVHVAVVVKALGGTRPQQLRGLLHDASETYLVDLPSPLKHGTELGDAYKRLEAPVQEMIYLKYGVEGADTPLIKRADLVCLATEARDLLSPLNPIWDQWLVEKPVPWPIHCWKSETAEINFLALFRELHSAGGAKRHRAAYTGRVVPYKEPDGDRRTVPIVGDGAGSAPDDGHGSEPAT